MPETLGQPAASCDAPALMESWELLNGFVEAEAMRQFGPGKIAYQFRLACEELFSNIIRHARCGRDGESCAHIWLRSWPLQEPQPGLMLEIEDDGSHFDPGFDKQRVIDLAAPIEERPIGGLGLYLVQNSVDSVAYAWLNERNRYTLRSFGAAPPPAV